MRIPIGTGCAFYLFIRQSHGSEVSPAARNTLDSARIPRASKLLICGLFQKGRVLAQDAVRFTFTVQLAVPILHGSNTQGSFFGVRIVVLCLPRVTLTRKFCRAWSLISARTLDRTIRSKFATI